MQRHYDIDALRILALGLLILYHIGMLYVPEWHYHLKASWEITGLEYLMRFVNAWRMPLVFLLSGAAIGLSNRFHRSSALGFVRYQSHRLLWPLLFAMIFTVPLQAYCQAVMNGSIAPGLAHFAWQYFTFAAWPQHAFDGSFIGVTWNHLWFLPYIFLYGLAMFFVSGLFSGFPVKPTERFGSVVRGVLLLLFWGWLIFLRLVVEPLFPERHTFYDDVFAHLYYASFFVVGFFYVSSAASAWRRFLVLYRRRIFYVALLAYFSAQSLKFFEPWLMFPIDNPYVCFQALFTITMLGVILGYASHYLNDGELKLLKLRRWIFPYYIWHQTVLIVLAFIIFPWQLSPVIEVAIILGGAVLVTLALSHLVVGKLPFLHSAFGLSMR